MLLDAAAAAANARVLLVGDEADEVMLSELIVRKKNAIINLTMGFIFSSYNADCACLPIKKGGENYVEKMNVDDVYCNDQRERWGARLSLRSAWVGDLSVVLRFNRSNSQTK